MSISLSFLLRNSISSGNPIILLFLKGILQSNFLPNLKAIWITGKLYAAN